MIIGFDDETAPLSDYELQLVPKFVNGFATKIGKENAITNKEIVAKMRVFGFKVSDARVRKIINHLRINNLVPCLMATSAGYYITRDADELKTFIASLKGRESAIAKVRESMEKQLHSLHF